MDDCLVYQLRLSRAAKSVNHNINTLSESLDLDDIGLLKPWPLLSTDGFADIVHHLTLTYAQRGYNNIYSLSQLRLYWLNGRVK